VRDDVAYPEIVAEAVGVHFLGEDFLWRTQRVDCFELLGEVPLSLICRVVTGFAQHVADRGDVGGHAADPWEISVVEHLRLLGVLAGVEHRTRGGAHAGVDLVVLEDDASSGEALVCRQHVVPT
jgi:hypothetical protein